MRHHQAIITLLSVPIFSGACGSGVPSVPPGERVSYSNHLEPLIIKRCIGCHTADEPEAELVLEQGRGYSQLVDRSSIQVPSVRIVEPGDPGASYLWRKLVHGSVKGEGMPRTLFGAKKLPEAELEFIRRWIEEGAKP
jgi:hypothetical protein